MAGVGAGRRREPSARPRRRRRRGDLLRHGRHVLARRVRGGHGHAAGGVLPGSRRLRARDQGVQPHVGRPERPGPVAQAHPGLDRRLAAAARHRPRRPLPDPPLGPAHADRGDDGGAARRRAGGQGALHRGVQHVRLAVRQGPARGRPRRLDPFRVHAGPLQPDLPRGGAGDAPALPRPGRRRDPVEPARPRTAGARPAGGRHHPGGHRHDRRRDVHRRRRRGRAGGRGRRQGPRAAARAGGAGLGAAARGGDGADHRGDQAGPRRGRDLGARRGADEDEVAALEAPYVPHPVLGHE